MKVQNWWVKPGLLTSGIYPINELATAKANFPPSAEPTVYMTGDAHRNPPLQWATKDTWPVYFDQFIGKKKVCCHVETFSDEVKPTSVSRLFEPVYNNHKVFGFEPNVFKITKEIINSIWVMRDDILHGKPQSKSKIDSLISKMSRVHDMKLLWDEGKEAMRHWDKIRKVPINPVPVAQLTDFSNFLSEYNAAAMALRTELNDEMGVNIQKIINEYPDHLHMITCGDAHIIDNPLYRYIEPPPGCYGIADQNKGM
jgi:hypothetical protein